LKNEEIERFKGWILKNEEIESYRSERDYVRE
jgi:hypothetical protein